MKSENENSYHEVALIVLLGWSFILYFGVHFSPQADPYTGKNNYILLIFVLCGMGYYIQWKQETMKRAVLSFFLFSGTQVLYFFGITYVITFFEGLFE